jgi:hypothetical protein
MNKQKIKLNTKIYRENNRDKIKQYYLLNKEKLLIKNKEYRDTHCQEMSNYRKVNKEKIKEANRLYRINKGKEYYKEYYEKNKILKYNIEPVKIKTIFIPPENSTGIDVIYKTVTLDF